MSATAPTSASPIMPSSSSSSSSFDESVFVNFFLQKAVGHRHGIGILDNGKAYSWGKSNQYGQLGRLTSGKKNCKHPAPVELPTKALKAYVSNGSYTRSGHSGILDEHGMLWMTGNDRWLQLGLCEHAAKEKSNEPTTTSLALIDEGNSREIEVETGIGGIAKRIFGGNRETEEEEGKKTVPIWKDGKLKQERFVSAPYVSKLIQNEDKDGEETNLHIQDVSLGDNHTLVLSSNRRSVYAFGRGMEGQLGLENNGKLFMSPPKRSILLSENNDTENDENSSTNNGGDITKGNIHAVCAIQNCSATLDENGYVNKKVGKCKSQIVTRGIFDCIARARDEGLVK